MTGAIKVSVPATVAANGDAELHLWYARVPTEDADPLAASQYALLCSQERLRMGHYRTEALQRRYRVTRALVRTALASHTHAAPQRLRFAETSYGRPEIAEPLELVGEWHFNVSHTEDLVVVLIGRQRAFGVDIEDPARPAPWRVAQHFFAEPEIRLLEGLPPARRAARFWDLWTLKESYAKALGLGLSLPFDTFWFEFDEQDRIVMHIETSPLHPGGIWSFFQSDLLGHRLALCTAQHTATPIRVQLWESIPTLQVREGMLLPTRSSRSEGDVRP